jgi:glycerol 3-phosphatase-2
MGENHDVLKASDQPLSSAYDVAILDLDGVVYVGHDAVTRAPEALAAAKAVGMHLAFVTNNAARPPSDVGNHLREIGIDAADADVVTSAQAAARLLVGTIPEGSRVYVIGGEGLSQALRERGFQPVTEPGDEPVAVAQGYGPQMPWRQVVNGAMIVKSGLPWVVSNTDMTIPTAQGVGPGNGTLVRLVAEFAGREPEVAGKPQPPLFEETLERVGGSHPLVVGDRLDTDIEGATNVGWDSLLVLTGVTGLAELVCAEPRLRPTYIGSDLCALATPHEVPTRQDDGFTLGGWTVSVRDGSLVVAGDGPVDDWWRAVALAAWAHLDDTGAPVDLGAVLPPR